MGFKKVLGKLQKLLGELSQRFTLVFLVDELDRCLPEYAIKVLERLHHLSSGIANNITIISMDKSQLTTSIQRIFGFANPEKYLEKFIDFELKLNCGTVSEKITEKYADYIALFDKDIFQFNDSIEEFLQILFTDLDIRKQEQLVNRAKLVHTLLYSDAKDYSFMCMELLLAVLICIYDETSIFSVNPVYLSDYDQIFCPVSAKTQPTFSKFIAKKLKSLNFSHVQSIVENTDIYILPSPTSLYAALLFTWSWLHENRRGVAFQLRPNDAYANIANNHKDLKKFAEVIRMLK